MPATDSAMRFENPDDAIEALAKRLKRPSDTEACGNPLGRVLAKPIVADRDSPAANVSAMDGYAVRLADLVAGQVFPVTAQCTPGSETPPLGTMPVVQIFTGAVVPDDFDTVIKREDTIETEGQVQFPAKTLQTLSRGDNIRLAGENAPAGSEVLAGGLKIHAAAMAGLANFGVTDATVYRQVRIAIFTTGDEVVPPGTSQLEPWQLRNSNQVALAAMLSQEPFVTVTTVRHREDDRAALQETLAAALAENDTVVMTGGVSKGDYDYVPEVIETVGGTRVFHGLPIRPGKPILGATTETGKLILGLPGNPVSATINCHRFLLPLLRYQSGQSEWADRPAMIELTQPPRKSIPLHAMLLVRRFDGGKAELVASKGSGDLVALSNSDGYVSVSPSEQHVGPWPFFPWNGG